MSKEAKVGISGISFSPTLELPGTIGRLAEKAGADFWVYVPGYWDLFVGSKAYAQLTFPVLGVEGSYWEDRRVELATPLDTLRLTPRKVLISLGFPVPPFAQLATARAIGAFPNSFLIRRWPAIDPSWIVDDPERQAFLAKRNEALYVYPHRREILDIHSGNQRMRPSEYIAWLREEGWGRRLMVTFPDERLPEHGISQGSQDRLLEPLLPYVSVLTLKVADVWGTDGTKKMDKRTVAASIWANETNTPYANRLRKLLEEIGRGTYFHTDLVIKVKGNPGQGLEKPVSRDDFLARFVDYVKEVAVRA